MQLKGLPALVQRLEISAGCEALHHQLHLPCAAVDLLFKQYLHKCCCNIMCAMLTKPGASRTADEHNCSIRDIVSLSQAAVCRVWRLLLPWPLKLFTL